MLRLEPYIRTIKYNLAQTNLKLAKNKQTTLIGALRDAGRKDTNRAAQQHEGTRRCAARCGTSTQTDYLLAEIDLKNLMGVPFYSGSTPEPS